MIFHDIQINEYSQLNSRFMMNEEGTVLFAKYSGRYGCGSKGNGDGIFMFSMLAAYYLVWEPVAIILDLQDLDYEWGNTVFKTINFFSVIGRDEYEVNKKIIIVVSAQNASVFQQIEKRLEKGNRAYCSTYEEAVVVAENEVRDFLDLE